MAKLLSGILGSVRGKVAGVVGSQWKNVNTLREYVIPANPNTASQQVQRGKMADVVEFCKSLVGPIFNAYTDRFLKGMSGFNFFIKRHIAEFDGSPVYANVKLTEGKLSPISAPAFEYTTGTGGLAITWGANKGNNGEDDDQIYWAVYDSSDGLWYFSDGEVDRVAGSDSQTIKTGLTATDLECWTLAAKYSNTLVTMVSETVQCQSTAP